MLASSFQCSLALWWRVFTHSNCHGNCAKAIRKMYCHHQETRAASSRNAWQREAECMLFISLFRSFYWCFVFFLPYFPVNLHISLLHSHRLRNPARHLLLQLLWANTTHLRVNYAFLVRAEIAQLVTPICLRRPRSKQCMCSTVTSEPRCCVVLLSVSSQIKSGRGDVKQPELENLLITIPPGSSEETGDGWQARRQSGIDVFQVSVNCEQHDGSHDNIRVWFLPLLCKLESQFKTLFLLSFKQTQTVELVAVFRRKPLTAILILPEANMCHARKDREWFFVYLSVSLRILHPSSWLSVTMTYVLVWFRQAGRTKMKLQLFFFF